MTGHDLDLDDSMYEIPGSRLRELSDTIADLRAKLAAAEQGRDALRLIATEAVDAIGSGHSEHWDPTMSYGAGCAACNRERGLRDRLRNSLAATEQDEPKHNGYDTYVEQLEKINPELGAQAREVLADKLTEPKLEQS